MRRDCLTPSCKRSFADASSLSYHIATKHSVVKPSHVCLSCGMGFVRKTSLNRHMLVHAEKTQSCHVCGKTFRRNDSRQRHVQGHTSFQEFKYDTRRRQVVRLLEAVHISGCVMDPCGGAGTELQEELVARGHSLITNDKWRDARHHRDVYNRGSLMWLRRRYSFGAVVTSPPYGREIQSAIDNILSLKAPVTALKLPLAVAKRQKTAPTLVDLPRERYPGFKHTIKYPECWAIWFNKI
eukprot:Lithocolla_globosa_v1_NODE_6_length_11976_cov_15.425432.p5 type:complete len:239 gc:universal NODE_6_length_11976_cov_15.425432:6596-5880(-)